MLDRVLDPYEVGLYIYIYIFHISLVHHLISEWGMETHMREYYLYLSLVAISIYSSIKICPLQCNQINENVSRQINDIHICNLFPSLLLLFKLLLMLVFYFYKHKSQHWKNRQNRRRNRTYRDLKGYNINLRCFINTKYCFQLSSFKEITIRLYNCGGLLLTQFWNNYS